MSDPEGGEALRLLLRRGADVIDEALTRCGEGTGRQGVRWMEARNDLANAAAALRSPEGGKAQPDGAERIAAERQRQIEVEGYDAAHDHGSADELSLAAACYALSDPHPRERRIQYGDPVRVPDLWPWRKEFWKPTPDNRIRELEKAGALIAAAIDAILDV